MKTMKPKNIKKVMIALKNDESSKKVAEEGFAIAKTMNAEVVLLNVISSNIHQYTKKEFQPISGISNETDTSKSHLAIAEIQRTTIGKFLDKTKHHLGDNGIETIVMEGEHSNSILSYVLDNNIDLLVMGAHSYNSLDTIVLGSVTEKVAQNILIPLVIVPAKKHVLN
jgi:nucleotide-binding universal stress UspA family protein